MIRDDLKLPPGIKIALQMAPEPGPDELEFAHGLGMRYATAWTDAAHATPEYYASRRQAFAEAGLTLYGLGNSSVHNVDDIVLGLPGREAKIELYKKHQRNLAAAGIPYSTYAHMANGIWSTARETTRGATARAFDERAAASATAGGTARGTLYSLPLTPTHERAYSPAEIWDNYTYFIRAVAPLAEQLGVLIGIHPDDPPGLDMGGVPRCIFSSYDGYERALEIANSPNVGMCLCVGCWLEGGPRMGRDVFETIRHFGGQGKIFKVHFRNVDAPLPHFVETYLDNGYMDMRRVMQALNDVGFNGVLIADHTPHLGSDPRLDTAYTVGYMQALLAGVEARAFTEAKA
jgi:mannonate dehydratase